MSVCAEWILNFVQEILGVRTGPQGSWFHPANSLPEFLICEAQNGPIPKLPAQDLKHVQEQLDCLYALNGS